MKNLEKKVEEALTFETDLGAWLAAIGVTVLILSIAGKIVGIF